MESESCVIDMLKDYREYNLKNHQFKQESESVIDNLRSVSDSVRFVPSGRCSNKNSQNTTNAIDSIILKTVVKEGSESQHGKRTSNQLARQKQEIRSFMEPRDSKSKKI